MVTDSAPIIVGNAMLVAKVSVACIAPAGMMAKPTRNRWRGDRAAPSSAVLTALIALLTDLAARSVPSAGDRNRLLPAPVTQSLACYAISAPSEKSRYTDATPIGRPIPGKEPPCQTIRPRSW